MPERLRGDRDAAALQRPHRQPESLIDGAEHLVVADLDVEVEIHAAEAAHAERIGARRPRDARRVHRHEKRRDALAAQARAACTRRRSRRAPPRRSRPRPCGRVMR